MTDVSVRLLTARDRPRWDAFVQACPEASFFHLSGWQRVVEEAGQHPTWFYMAEEAGEITGVLPLAEVRSRLFGHAVVSLPFCVYGGIASASQAAFEALRMAAERLAEGRGAGHLELRQAAPDAPLDGYGTRDLYSTFRKPIAPDTQANLAAVPRKQRAVIRKAIAADYRVRIVDDPDEFYPLYAQSVHRLGTPVFPRALFERLHEVFGKASEFRLIMAGKRPLAALQSFYFREAVLPYYAGGTLDARAGANDFMYWSLMCDAAVRGCTVFDFGRSKLGSGAFDFKKNWGFAPAPLPYAYKLLAARALPDSSPRNPRYAQLIRAWKRLPLPLANMLGPGLARYLG
ncbi:MAG: FemAB family XrtA/PEP-CTERM system-associated protein [Telluria sp.]